MNIHSIFLFSRVPHCLLFRSGTQESEDGFHAEGSSANKRNE
ncbi:MAG: hypothetical protein AB2804_11490 [Candidatus Thiodiazotropha endolucinida]